MKLFPLTVVDDFYDNPDEVLDIAMNAEYHHREDDHYPGGISQQIYLINERLCHWTIEKMMSIYFGQFNFIRWGCVMDFQKIEPHPERNTKPLLNKGTIHWDPEDCKLAGVIYLNKEPSRDAGTSFYKPKDQFYCTSDRSFHDEYVKKVQSYHLGKDIPDIEEVLEKHYNEYEETARVQAQYNRLSMYSPYTMHAPTSYGDKIRYTLRCFITRIEAPHETYPLNRRT